MPAGVSRPCSRRHRWMIAGRRPRSSVRANGVLAAGTVTQMDRCGVSSAAPDPGQAMETSPCSDSDHAGPGLAEHDIQARVIAARQPQDRMTTEHPPGSGIAPSGDPDTAPVGNVDHTCVG